MSQNDFNLANQGFPAMRADMNSAFQALASNSAGTTEPSTTYAYQWWYDETTDILKIRNADDDAWINIASFDQANDTWSPYVGATALTATGAELNQLDGNVFTAGASIAGDFIPDADSTRDLGSASVAWALGFFDELRVTTVSNAAGTGPVTLTGQSAAKAWNYIVSATATPSIGASFNVSSIADEGTGLFRTTLTNAMASANYPLAAIAASGSVRFSHESNPAGNKTASTTRVEVRDASGTVQDPEAVSYAIHGDLA